jgi:hypothetical protein
VGEKPSALGDIGPWIYFSNLFADRVSEDS